MFPYIFFFLQKVLKMYKTLFFSFLLIISIHVINNNTIAAQSFKASATVTNFVKTATGIFDNQKTLELQQIDTLANPKWRRQLVLCYPIWEDAKDAYWMYFGWFLPQDKSNALEEMFLRIIDDENGNPIAQWYKFPAHAKKEDAQEWTKTKPFDNIIPEEITNNEDKYLFTICDIITDGSSFTLKAKEKGIFNESKYSNFHAMLIDMTFNTDSYSTASKFFNTENEIILEQEHKIPLLKISKKYKKF